MTKIKIVKTGVNFGYYTIVKQGRKVLHETRVYSHSSPHAALDSAMAWCAGHGIEQPVRSNVTVASRINSNKH